MSLIVKSVVWHIIQDLHPDYEAEILDLSLQVEHRPVEDFDLAIVEELAMVLAHQGLALSG